MKIRVVKGGCVSLEEKKKKQQKGSKRARKSAKRKKKKSSGKRDACYHKVKSRYDVWPSAYASGALVKCRKVGASNWGNKSKKNESIENFDEALVNKSEIPMRRKDDLETVQKMSQEIKDMLKGLNSRELELARYKINSVLKSLSEEDVMSKIMEVFEQELEERCQKGYKTHEKRKTKKMYGKTYRNCVKAEESMDPEALGEVDNIIEELFDSLEEKKKKKKRKKRKGGKRDGKGASSKGYTLRDWFKGGGWVQTGGKHDGKPCAKQPGQKTKPYCRDPDDRARLSKKERDKRASKKRKNDPNPNRKGKAINVRQKKSKRKKS